MIWWITGESGSGKTTLAKKLKTTNSIFLDADTMRPAICEDLGFSEADRRANNLRVARLAKVLDDQEYDVIVSTICPYEDLKQQVYWICKCRFIKVEGQHQCVK